MQLVDVMLSHLDLRNADLTGLQVFSDLPLIGATSWCSQGKLHIAAVNSAGQCIQYTMDGTEISSRYSTKIYGSEKGIEDEDLFPRFTVSNTHGVLVQCRGNDLYNLQEQSLLYKFSSNKKLYQIIPFREGEKDGAYILFKLGDYLSVASFLDNYAKWYDAFDDPESMMVFIDPHNIVSFQGGSFFLRDLDNDNSYTIIAKQCYDVQCFTAFKEDSRLSVVYKAKHSIGFLHWDGEKASGNLLEPDDAEFCNRSFRSIHRITNNTFVACSKNKLLLIQFTENNFTVTELKASVECHDLKLEDSHGNRMRDDAAYSILHG